MSADDLDRWLTECAARRPAQVRAYRRLTELSRAVSPDDADAIREGAIALILLLDHTIPCPIGVAS